MTLQQLKYVTTIANIGSISEAAKRLFVSQPSLTKAIKELEKEMGITIFDRTNKGITVSKEGERFLGYARQEYPYISFEQGDHNSFYFSEEIFSTVVRPKHIRVRDRASLFSLLLGLDGYTVSSGVIDEEVNGENIISVPLAEEGLMHIGYITNNKMHRSRLGQEYIQALEQYVGNYGRHIQLPDDKNN